jgi:hypothetical protein
MENNNINKNNMQYVNVWNVETRTEKNTYILFRLHNTRNIIYG